MLCSLWVCCAGVMHLYADVCGWRFGPGLAALKSSWAVGTTKIHILWSGSTMLEFELKPGNHEFLACGLPRFNKMLWVKSLYGFTMVMACMLFCGHVLW